LAKGNGQSIRHSVTINRDLLYYAVRQPVTGGPPVVLRFALPLQTVDEVLREFRKRLWLASVVMLLATGAASLLISRSFSNRVDRLTAFSRRVAEGNFRPLMQTAQAMLWKLWPSPSMTLPHASTAPSIR